MNNARPARSPALLPSADRRSSALGRGFTLLEVMVAMSILAMFLVPLLGGVISGLSSIERTQNLQLARQLALNKLDEVQMTVLPEMELQRDGDFGPEHPEYKWQVTFRKRPELELLEQNIAGLLAMETVVTVAWMEAGEERTLVLTSLMAR
jgi:type II secretion system protein I